MEEGQVTRVTYPNDAKNNPKFKSGDRAWVYYVDQAILSESKKLKEQKDTSGNQLESEDIDIDVKIDEA